MKVDHGPLRLALAFIALTSSVAAAPARAAPITWDRLCSAVGDFAGLLAVHRNEGTPASVAIAITRGLFSDGPPELLDRAVTSEIARQVYATPTLTPEQETASLKGKCLTPDADANSKRPTRTTVSGHAITHLVPVPLDRGMNRIEAAEPGGRAIDVALDWQDEGEGHGHDVFTVTMPPAGPGPAAASTIADNLHEGDDVLVSIRFARGDVDGRNALLLLRAAREPPAAKVVPTPTVFEIYRLVPSEPGSDSRVAFELIERRTLARRFCNADMALSEASGLPLRQSYRGPRTANGCPESMASRP